MLDMNDLAALKMVLTFIDTKNLLLAAIDGLQANNSIKSKDTIELLNKCIIAYLN